MANFDHLATLSVNYELSWYLDTNNIPNGDLPRDTISFLEAGPRAGYMPPIVFLNFLLKQFDYVYDHLSQGPSIVQYFEELPVDKDLLHMLLAHLLKWYGGYPVNFARRDQQSTMKAIEKLLLSYPGDTPEKEFAKMDMDFAHYLQKLGIAFTAAYLHGMDVIDILDGMPADKKREETFNNFDALFAAAMLYKAIGPFNGHQHQISSKATINLEFNVWLTEFKGWEYGDDDGYRNLLTKSNLLVFLKYRDDRAQQQRDQYLSEVDSWDYRKHQFTDISKGPPTNHEKDATNASDQPVKDNHAGEQHKEIVFNKLLQVKDAFKTESDYAKAVAVIVDYLQHKHIPKKDIVVNNKWKRRLAYALGEIHREFNAHVPIGRDYLVFYTKAFSIFEKDVIDENHIFGDKLYKYSMGIG